MKIGSRATGEAWALNRSIASYTLPAEGKETNTNASYFVGCATKRIIYNSNYMLETGVMNVRVRILKQREK